MNKLNRIYATRPGDGEGEPLDPNDPRVVAIVKAANQQLEANRDTILQEKRTLDQQFAEFKKQWDGLDPEQVRNLMKNLNESEEAKLIAEGKMDEVFQRRTDALKGDFTKRLDAAEIRENELKSENGKLLDRVKNLLIEGSLRTAAAEHGLLPSAIEDAMYRGKGLFSLGEGDTLVAKDPDGSVRLGKDGKNPLTPAEWLESMKDKAPHWFPGSSGIGAGGSDKGGQRGTTVTITRDQARNPATYRAAKEQAEKLGKQLVIAD